MEKKKYALAIDLDGTALNSYGKLSEYTKSVFDQAISEGYEIIVASGRALESLPEEVRSYPGIRYAITSNGAAVHDMQKKIVLKNYYMDPEAVQMIIELTRTEDIVYEAFIDGHGFGEKDYVEHPENYGVTSSGGIRYIQRTRKPVENMISFMLEHQKELDCIDIVLNDLDEKNRIWKKIKEKNLNIMITTSVDRLIEIADINAGKGNAFSNLLDFLDIPVSNTAAFGNAENDIAMMKVAFIGYAVSNADEICLKEVDKIVASNDEDGVAKGILDFMNLKRGQRERN